MFFKDYASAHKKMSELGCKDTSPAFWSAAATTSKDSSDTSSSTSLLLLGQAAVGFTATAAVLVLGYLYELRRKAK